MNISIRNGLVAGALSFGIFVLPTVLNLSESLPIGILSIAVILLFMWNTAKYFKDRETFREHVREPFITFLIANLIFFLGRLAYAGSGESVFSKEMMVLFLFGLILGFVLAGIITLVVRKSAT